MDRVTVKKAWLVSNVRAQRKHVDIDATKGGSACQLIDELLDTPIGIWQIGLEKMQNPQRRARSIFAVTGPAGAPT